MAGRGRQARIPGEVAERMRGRSWRAGCPVALDELAYLRVPHVAGAGGVREGELIVHAALAEEVLDIFEELLLQGFPVERMALVDEFAADDHRSMAANNTSGFNFRPNLTAPERLSWHSFGRAIDVNPLWNPYLRHPRLPAVEALAAGGGELEVLPPDARAFVDRERARPGLIVAGDACHAAFTRRGWVWGGAWVDRIDYQHFEKPLAR